MAEGHKEVGSGRVDMQSMLCGVKRHGTEIIVPLAYGEALTIRNYYRDLDGNGGSRGPDAKHRECSEEEVREAALRMHERLLKKREEYSALLTEPILNKIIRMEEEAMAREALDLKFSASFAYKETINYAIKYRCDPRVINALVDRADAIYKEWQGTGATVPNGGGWVDQRDMDPGYDIEEGKKTVKVLLLLGSAELERINKILDGYYAYLLYPREIVDHYLYPRDEYRKVTDPAQIKSRCDDRFEELLKAEYFALISESMAQSSKNNSLLWWANAAKFHLRFTNNSSKEGYAGMAKESFAKAQVAFEHLTAEYADAQNVPANDFAASSTSLRNMLEDARRNLSGE